MNEQTMNQVLKLKINKFTDNKLEVDQDKLIKHSTLMRESELLRIVKYLNPDNTKSTSKRSNYPYIKDVIITDIGDETQLYKDTKGYLTFNEDIFKRLMASSGNIRNSKTAFVKESIFDKANDILLCGLPIDQKYDVFAKFSSYFALCSTDSIPLSFIPRIVIIDDFTHEIEETFDLVKETGKDHYEVVNNQKQKTEIMPFDGAGLLSVECAEKFCNDLGIDISKDDKEEESKSRIPACWQFRFIPCGKGDLFTFDIKVFALEKEIKQITDMWGKVWDLFDAEGNLLVDVVLTKSQFKFHKLYASYDTWLKAFTTKTHGYERTFNISAYSDTKHLNDSVVLSYQPLQTLSLSQDQVEKLCYKTVNTYKNIRNDIIEFVKYRGMIDKVDEETGEIQFKEDHYLPAYYQALKENVDLFKDDYIQSKIKNDLKGFRNRSCKGMLFLRGSFQTLIPDLVGLAQYAFRLPVTGVLATNEVYNQFWYSEKVERIGLCRFPHIAREWKLANLVKPDNEDTKYLDYITEGYVINIWDSTALRMGTADFDGDHIYGIAEGRLLKAIDNQESNTIVHIPPEQSEEEKKQPKPTYPINDMAKLIETDCNGMKGGIGQCVNDITTLWSLEQSEQRDNYIKIMSVIGAQIIDYAKTGILAKTPSQIKKFLSKHKLPYFMRYKYPKEFTKETRINDQRKIKGVSEPIEKLNRNQCTVNLICGYLEKQFAQIDKAAEDNQNNFEWQKLLKDKADQYSNTYKNVQKMMEEFNEMHSQISQERIYQTKPQDVNDNNYKYKIFYDYVRNSLLSLCRANADVDKILDYLLIICYTDKKYVDKAILWNCFPDEMVSRVKGEYFLEKDFDTSVFELKAKKAQKKIEQNSKASELVKVNLSIDQETKDDKGKIIQTKKINIDVNKIKVNIYQSEVDHIRRASLTTEQKGVLLVLLVINRLHKLNDARFFICPGKKNKITFSHICKLANLDIRKTKYDDIMKILYRDGFYKSPTGQTNLLIEIPFMEKVENVVEFTITDINDIKKYFKNILTKAS